jgi:short-subunit dehydrogenase
MTTKRVALVTGASSGIGEATANKLLAVGFTVYGTSRSGRRTSSSLLPFLQLDVTDDESVEAAVAELIKREGRIDLLVNNAGFGIAPAAAEESSIAQANSIFDTNFLGIVRMTKAVLPQMRRQGSGRIINISSILGVVPFPYVALYAASKHAVEGYSEALDHELRTQGIRVSVIEPAFTKTQFDANTVQADTLQPHYAEAMQGGDDPAVVADVVVKAAYASNPKIRYTAGAAAAQLKFLRRFAPAAMLDKLLRKTLKLDSAE